MDYTLLYILTVFMLINAGFVAFNTWILIKYRIKMKERDNYYNKIINEIKNSQREVFIEFRHLIEKIDKILKTNEELYN